MSVNIIQSYVRGDLVSNIVIGLDVYQQVDQQKYNRINADFDTDTNIMFVSASPRGKFSVTPWRKGFYTFASKSLAGGFFINSRFGITNVGFRIEENTLQINIPESLIQKDFVSKILLSKLGRE
jgi:hypothetical protein